MFLTVLLICAAIIVVALAMLGASVCAFAVSLFCILCTLSLSPVIRDNAWELVVYGTVLGALAAGTLSVLVIVAL